MFLISKIKFTFISDPELIYDKAQTGEEGFDGALDLFPQNFSLKQLQPELSGELMCILLYATSATTGKDPLYCTHWHQRLLWL